MLSVHTLRKHVGTASFVLCIALMPALAQAAGPMAAAGSSDVGAFAAGGTVGFQTGNGLTQFRLTGEGQYGLLMLQPQLELDLAGHLGLLLGDNVTTFEIVPEARIRYLVDRK